MIFMIRMSAEKMHSVFSLYQQSGYYFTRAHYPVLQTVQCHRSRRVTAENAGHSVTAVYFSDKANFYISGSSFETILQAFVWRGKPAVVFTEDV